MADKFSKDFLPPENFTFNPSFSPEVICFYTELGSIVFTAYNTTTILLLLPLCIFILYLGRQKWKRNGSSSSLRISHSDFLTYHMVVIELVGVVGCVLICCSIYNMDEKVLPVGFFFHNISWSGQTYVHILTCVERHLAVVHPITYLHLQDEKGMRIRNVSIVCVWLLCFPAAASCFTDEPFIIASFCILIFALTVISFCSVSVLCVLISPCPREQVGGRRRTNQVKRRAFYTILTILGVLVLRFSFALLRIILFVPNKKDTCELELSDMWLNVPNSLILPLLFLQKAGKLKCFKKKQTPDNSTIHTNRNTILIA